MFIDGVFVLNYNEYKTSFNELECEPEQQFDKELVHSITIKVGSTMVLEEWLFHGIPQGLGDCLLYIDDIFMYACTININDEAERTHKCAFRKCLMLLQYIIVTEERQISTKTDSNNQKASNEKMI